MKVIICASGAGGHVFPALILAKRLRQENSQVYFVVDKVGIESRLIENGLVIEFISATKISFSSIVDFLKGTINLIKSFFESLDILKRVKPSVVIGFGGYASFPIVSCAWLYRIPIIIHEQNVIPGKANRILSFFSKKIAVSFIQTIKYFPANKKIIYTGCPVRQELFEVRREDSFKFFNLNPDKFTILVMGGSRGSHKINEEFVKAVSLIREKSQFQIIHLTGDKDLDYVRSAFDLIGAVVCCVAFLEKMGYAYNIADLVISRAGASSLAEIVSFKIPSILIPYPFAYNHQMANALSLEKKGVAIVIEDKNLSKDKLKEILSNLLDNKGKLKAMKECFNRIAVPDATKNLVQLVISLVDK
ncbi:MAG: undecaprenyldiphospho-muramoylpentapeptide beta-N-acetylglucosaminyltransferase [Candidatus Omnitrophota bacterium]|nr:undecaprenyldiphospho-muramoylpentapeptide beta-N-acetylglucosaminyltransferase [Candidatus Omnitrophota bacterium]